MKVEHLEDLWLSYFDERLGLDIAARHALDEQTLTDEDLACFAKLRKLAVQARTIAALDMTESEGVSLAQLQNHLNTSCGRAESYLLASAAPRPR